MNNIAIQPFHTVPLVNKTALQSELTGRMHEILAVQNRLNDSEFDLYSPPTSYWSKLQNLPGEQADKIGHTMLDDLAVVKDSLDPVEYLMTLGLFNAGFSVGGETMLASILNRFLLFDQFEVFLKRDPDCLKKGYLVGRVDYEAERLNRICPEKYPDPHQTFEPTQADKDMAEINKGRWYLPYVYLPAVDPGINLMFKNSIGLDLDQQWSFIPDNNYVPPLWQEDMPQHPWQSWGDYPNGWMDKGTPSHGFLAKGPLELEWESKQKRR